MEYKNNICIIYKEDRSERKRIQGIIRGDPYCALTTSISVRRFMLESLAWEKWPCFSNNRFLEEAKKSSKLGLAAQRKAYFEALYKRNAAKKAGDSSNPASNDLSEPNVMEETAQTLQEFQLGHQ
ncbi:uncharacterized protein LOC114265234 [Camellia sinensis]|uniref:uncharacterized protein LOC114265234 n=1 Tax=Camellia sinensis TaxID=4442 RepID=UPI001035CDB7|nr:uncharacterized protein LOC114265234 [Camellia sinensis]